MQENDQEINLSALVESVLFVASGPVPVARLARTLEVSQAVIRNTIAELETVYADRGLRLQINNNEVQLTTHPAAAGTIERFLGLELTTRLSQAALEVLAIVAYMQPVTRPQIDQIRGVNSDGALRTLLSHGLIEEVGRMDTPGRPILYSTTPEFLQYFGLTIIDELPELQPAEEIPDEVPAAEVDAAA